MSYNLTLQIRPLVAAELQLLRNLAEKTFVEAFGGMNTKENMQQYVSKAFAFDQVRASFYQEGVSYFVGWHNSQAVAYLKINEGPAQTESFLNNALEIERIYVKATYQGKGIGQQLLSFAIQSAEQGNKSWLWLGVWDQNRAAIRFYERHGFSIFDQHKFYLGNDLQNDLLLRLKL